MSKSISSKEQNVDDLSLREILKGAKQAFLYIVSHWMLLLLTSILCVGGLYWWYQSKPITYTAKLTFMLNDDSGGQLSGMNGILGQLGLPIPSGKYNIDKLLEISLSRSRIQEALFQKIELEGTTDFISNHLIELYDLDERWVLKRNSMAGFNFSSSAVENFNPDENYALKNIYALVAGSADDRSNALLQVGYGREAYIMDFSMTSLSEGLSIEFVKRLFDEVSEFYISKAVEKPMKIYKSMAAKRDSLEKEWINVETSIANKKDSNFGSFGSQTLMEINRLTSQALILKTGLAQAEQNLVVAELSLSNNTPLIQKIDDPLPPLSPNKVSIVRILFLGLVVAIFLSSIYLLIREIIVTEV